MEDPDEVAANDALIAAAPVMLRVSIMTLTAYDPSVVRHIKRRLHALAVAGNTGGWVNVDGSVTRWPDQSGNKFPC